MPTTLTDADKIAAHDELVTTLHLAADLYSNKHTRQRDREDCLRKIRDVLTKVPPVPNDTERLNEVERHIQEHGDRRGISFNDERGWSVRTVTKTYRAATLREAIDAAMTRQTRPAVTEPAQVFVAVHDDGDGYDVLGVYSTRDNAQVALDAGASEHIPNRYIYPFVLDAPLLTRVSEK